MLDQMLFNTAKLYPQNTALVFDGTRISYEKLYRQACGLSSGLASLGLKSPDCVALILPNCPEFVMTFYALARLNCTVLPVNPLLKKEEIRYYLEDCQVKAIVTDAAHLEVCQLITADMNSTVELIICDGNFQGATCFDDLVFKDAGNYLPAPPGDAAFLYQYSSGSTGRPKKVVRTQPNLFWEAENFTTTCPVSGQDRILGMVPLFHAHGLGNCLLAATRSGATLVILEQFKRDGLVVEVPFIARCGRVIELIELEEISILPGVPYIFSALADLPDETKADFSLIRLCFSAGNFLPKATFDKFLSRFKLPIRQLYGCTEAGSVTFNLAPNVAENYNSVGLPLGNTKVKIVDEAGKPVGTGKVGEIIFKNRALTSGYYNMPELNKTAFRKGWFFTGDLGRKDRAGELYVTGRKKIFIDSGGFKVDPLELEDLLVTHPKVSEAVVVGVESPFGGELIKAVVVPRANCQENEIIAFCRENLADFKVPRLVQFVSQIPKSPLGKILRKDLVGAAPKQFVDKTEALSFGKLLKQTGSTKERYLLLENKLREQLAALLGLELSQIDPLKPLGDFGLDSLKAIELAAWLEQVLDREISATLAWNYPNLIALTQYLVEITGNEPTKKAETLQSQEFLENITAEIAWLEKLPEAEIQQLLAQQTEQILQAHSGFELYQEQITFLSLEPAELERFATIEIKTTPEPLETKER